MILQSLHRLAIDEGLVDDPDFEVRPVTWLVDVGTSGQLLGIRSTVTAMTESIRGKSRVRLVAQPRIVPRQPKRTSGDRAFFFVDKPDYSLGLFVADPTKPEEVDHPARRARRLALFRENIDRCLSATNDEGVKAVAVLLANLASGSVTMRLPEGAKPGDLCEFIFQPDVDLPVHQRPAVIEYWRSLRGALAVAGGAQRCLVTGEIIQTPTENFPGTKRIPGANPAGGSLVAFNAEAFESFGLTRNANAPMSRAAAEACGAAMSRLFDDGYRLPTDPTRSLPKWSVRLGGDTVVGFWAAPGAGRDLVDQLAALLTVEDPDRVGEAYRSIWAGRPTTIHDPTAFYAMTLAGAQGRLVIRDWFESSVAAVGANLSTYFSRLAVVRNCPPARNASPDPAIPLKTLLGSVAPFGIAEDVPAPLVTAFVSAALRGARYPLAMLLRAVERARAEIGRSEWSDLARRDARAALIKAVLISHFNLSLSPDMDPTNVQPGYLLGRLMALLERLQQAALGDDLNASVVDRYFGAASATPRAVFVRLLKGARHHARKAADDTKTEGTARWLDRQIDEIVARFPAGTAAFPAYLRLEEQGLFILGYHQQRHYLWLSKDERVLWDARNQSTSHPAA